MIIVIAIMFGAFPGILFFLLWLGDLQIYDFPELYYRIPCYNMPSNWGYLFDIYVDRETRVQYLCLSTFEAPAKFIDSDGNPILYTGDFRTNKTVDRDTKKPNRFYHMNEDNTNNNLRFYSVYVDRETRVQYIKQYPSDSITPYLNRDNKPVLYKGDFN
jgi:hypothetical protein